MVNTYVQLLGKRYKGKLDADADAFIEYAHDAAVRMQHLIDDLLAFARVDKRGSLIATDANAALDRALASLRLSVEDTRAVVTHDLLPTLPADPGQLEQVFLNLVGNAIKFHGARWPEVHISATRHDGGWLFTVRDNGIGIDPQYFDRIFVMLQRLHAKTRTRRQGTGSPHQADHREHGGRIGSPPSRAKARRSSSPFRARLTAVAGTRPIKVLWSRTTR